MTSIKCAFWILIGTVLWYLVTELAYTAESMLGANLDVIFYSRVYNGIAAIVTVLHYSALLWIVYALLRKTGLPTSGTPGTVE